MREVTLVVNSGPLIALSLVNQLQVLPRLYRRILVPPAVVREVVELKTAAPGADLLQQAPWIQVAQVSKPSPLLPAFLGLGEVEAITLASEQSGSLLLIDDYRARRVAEAMGLTAVGTAGVLVRAKQEGQIKAVAPLLEALRQNGYFISDKVVAKAREKAGE